MKAATFDHRHSLPRKAISIHAAREGGDLAYIIPKSYIKISIHAAREGGDLLFDLPVAVFANFNPRRP